MLLFDSCAASQRGSISCERVKMHMKSVKPGPAHNTAVLEAREPKTSRLSESHSHIVPHFACVTGSAAHRNDLAFTSETRKLHV